MIPDSAQTHIFLLNPLSFPYWAAAAISVLIVLALLWKEARRRVSAGWALCLIGLRALVLAAIFWLLLDPVQYQDQRQNEDWLGLVLDTSASMGAATAQGKLSRLETALERIEDLDAWKSLAAKHPIRAFHFDEQVQALDQAASARVSQNPSNLVNAMTDLDREFGGDPNFMGWILVSDGSATDWQNSSESILKKLRRGVITLEPGLESKPFNLSLGAPEIQEYAFSGQILPLRLTWTHEGGIPAEVLLQVHLQGKPVFSQKVSAAYGEIEMEVPVDGEGVLPLEAVLGPAEGEVFKADNYSRVWLKVQKRKIKVFYAESVYKNENAFKNALEEDADFKVDFATSLVGFAKEKRVPFILDPLYGFPATKEKFFDYDALILSDVKRSLLKPEQMEWIEEWVKERGGALIMVGGMDSFGDGGYCRSQLEQLLPVEISEDYQTDVFLKARGIVDQPFRIKVSSGAFEHPLLQITGTPETDKRLWAEMPPLGGYNYVGRVKPGATLLWQHPADKSKFGARAILAVQPFGRGQVMAFTSDITPNWGTEFLGWKDEKEGWIYARFWRETLKWMTRGRLKELTEPLDVQRTPHLVTADDTVEFRLAAAESVRQARVDFTLFHEDQLEASRTLYGGAQTGPFVWNAGILAPGLYELRVTVTPAGETPLTANRFFSVHESRNEARHLEMNPETLKKVAALTGGVYLSDSQWNRLEQAVLKMGQRHMKLRAEPIWNKLWIYLIILAMLCCEWFIRKKKGFES